MSKPKFPPSEIYLSPHCDYCMNQPWEMEILWTENPVGDICHICDRREIRYALDKRYLRDKDK